MNILARPLQRHSLIPKSLVPTGLPGSSGLLHELSRAQKPENGESVRWRHKDALETRLAQEPGHVGIVWAANLEEATI